MPLCRLTVRIKENKALMNWKRDAGTEHCDGAKELVHAELVLSIAIFGIPGHQEVAHIYTTHRTETGAFGWGQVGCGDGYERRGNLRKYV